MKQNKKELIRKTAIDVFAELGYHSATTDRIAQEAQVAVGTIYNYFRSKEEILEYIFLVELEKRRHFYHEVQNEELTVVEKIRVLLKKHFTEVAQNPAVGQILVRERQFPNNNQLTAITEFIEGIPCFFQRLLDQAIERKEIRPCNTRIIGAALFGAVQGVVSNAVFETDQSQQATILAKAADELTEFLCSGLQTAGR